MHVFVCCTRVKIRWHLLASADDKHICWHSLTMGWFRSWHCSNTQMKFDVGQFDPTHLVWFSKYLHCILSRTGKWVTHGIGKMREGSSGLDPWSGLTWEKGTNIWQFYWHTWVPNNNYLQASTTNCMHCCHQAIKALWIPTSVIIHDGHHPPHHWSAICTSHNSWVTWSCQWNSMSRLLEWHPSSYGRMPWYGCVDVWNLSCYT